MGVYVMFAGTQALALQKRNQPGDNANRRDGSLQAPSTVQGRP